MAVKRQPQKGITVRRGASGLTPGPEELERFMDWPFRGVGPWRHLGHRWPRLWREQGWLPDIDVFQRDDTLVARADLPGMKRDDIEVAIEGDTLVLRGQRREEKEIKEQDYYYCERSAGAFSRAIRLPEGADAEHIEATYRDGVLEVTVPLAEAPKAKKVEIKVKQERP